MPEELPTLAVEIAAQLNDGSKECTVCIEAIGRDVPLWSCRRCHGVLHLSCVQFWAHNDRNTQDMEPGCFPCPLCRSAASTAALSTAVCYCGRTTDPRMDMALVPGACGAVCGRRRPDEACEHPCPLPCHPGPCPPCPRTREQVCYCGATERVVGCSSGERGFECEEVCGKELACGRHYCGARCHAGPCARCEEEPLVTCHCGAVTEARQCTPDLAFGCRQRCVRLKDCGRHRCAEECHPGPCADCPRTPARHRTCACGKVPLAAWPGGAPPERASCEDPLPTCGAVCQRVLPCGHRCQAPCHDGDCPPCPELVAMSCRCGKSQGQHPCFTRYIRLARKVAADDSDDDGDNPDHYDRSPWVEAAKGAGLSLKLLPKLYPPRCPRRCAAKKNCGRHSCSTVCCGDTEHICTMLCRKRAPCGIHECGQLCHRGPCPPCSHVSFDALRCTCGRTVIDPPVPCNTPPPRCSHPCSRPRECGHPPGHPCHTGECPPCTTPAPKVCASHGIPLEWFSPCHLPPPSCGKRCGNKLPCCNTVCTATCHNGPCACRCRRR